MKTMLFAAVPPSVLASVLLTLPRARPRLRLPRLHHAGFRLRGCRDFGADHAGDGAEWPRSPHLRHAFAEPGHLAFPAQSGGWR